MTAPTLYLWFPGNAAHALGFYHDVFGGELTLHTFTDMGRTDGPAGAIGHGILAGPVSLYGADTADDEAALSMSGVGIALLGTADGPTLTAWFDALSQDGIVLDALQKRPWGAYDGQVIDQFGIRWLIGYEVPKN